MKYKITKITLRSPKIKSFRSIAFSLTPALLIPLGAAISYCLPTQESALNSPNIQTESENQESKSIRANLGGSQVNIPTHFAENLEYDGDQGWSTTTSKTHPTRTKHSKIRSFGFDIRYPEMSGKNNQKNWISHMKNQSTDANWIGVGVISGENYTGPGSIARLSDNQLKRILSPQSSHPFERYEKLVPHQHGLEVYTLRDINPKNGKPYREHENADDIFLWRLGDGKVATHISCSNRQITSAPCRHRFSLEPEMHADAHISYRRSMLPDWRDIQEKVKATIISFSENS